MNLKIYSDGGARGNPGPAACAFIVFDENKVIHSEAKFLGNKTNNFAEYAGVLMALNWLTKKFKDLQGQAKYFLDSELVVNQLKGSYKIKSDNLKPIVKKIRKRESDLNNAIKYFYVPRAKNKLADHLVNKTLDAKKND